MKIKGGNQSKPDPRHCLKQKQLIYITNKQKEIETNCTETRVLYCNMYITYVISFYLGPTFTQMARYITLV